MYVLYAFHVIQSHQICWRYSKPLHIYKTIYIPLYSSYQVASLPATPVEDPNTDDIAWQPDFDGNSASWLAKNLSRKETRTSKGPRVG